MRQFAQACALAGFVFAIGCVHQVYGEDVISIFLADCCIPGFRPICKDSCVFGSLPAPDKNDSLSAGANPIDLIGSAVSKLAQTQCAEIEEMLRESTEPHWVRFEDQGISWRTNRWISVDQIGDTKQARRAFRIWWQPFADKMPVMDFDCFNPNRLALSIEQRCIVTRKHNAVAPAWGHDWLAFIFEPANWHFDPDAAIAQPLDSWRLRPCVAACSSDANANRCASRRTLVEFMAEESRKETNVCPTGTIPLPSIPRPEWGLFR